jgi:hypothetical protein
MHVVSAGTLASPYIHKQEFTLRVQVGYEGSIKPRTSLSALRAHPPFTVNSPPLKQKSVMANPEHCTHSFKILKSDTSLLLWNCGMCNSGPH